LTSDGLTVDGVAYINANNIHYTGSSPKINMYENDITDLNTQLIQTGGDLLVRTLSDDAAASDTRIRLDHATGDISFYEDTGTTAKFFWDASAERLGIGTSSPARTLEVYSSAPAIKLNNGTNAFTIGTGAFVDSSNSLVFFDEGVGERMRIDASGNLLVGKTSSDATATGFEAQGNGQTIIGRSNGTPLKVNRLTSDGDIAIFRKDGTNVGSIGVNNTDNLFISGNSTHAGLEFLGVSIGPHKNGSLVDNTLDIGTNNNRFDDIYATNGTIQTSDRNEKQDIAELSDAEQRVAVAAKGLLRKFRWRDAVADKGDDARTHFGIIAQDLQAAFAAEGLDAGDYAMFISTTWWETQTEVPAVEAVAEVLDEDGNVVTEAVEAADAYTRTDTYDTQEEAPEGATERTRLGVRYSELLAFIIGAL
jgi:hypothetical protein